MKQRIMKVFGLAAMLFCGTAGAAEGDIWEILPCTREGVALATPVSSAEQTIPAGSNCYFKVRLVSRDGATGTDRWHLYNKLTPGTEDYINPLRIGIYVSGRRTYAEYCGELEAGEHFTDIIFRYTVKPGDFALPIKLATANGPASDQYVEDLSYVFDPLTDWRWEFRCTTTDPTTSAPTTHTDCHWWFFRGDPMGRGEGSSADTADFSLRDAGFYLKTIDFDDQWEVKNVLWRSVHEGSTATVGATPSLMALGGPEEAVELYVWSTNEAAVKVVSDKQIEMRIGGTALSPVKQKFNVAVVKFVRGQLVSEFEISGVESNKISHLVLSAYDHFNFTASTQLRETDFVTVPVKCIEALPPSIIVKPSKATVTASSDYLDYVAELEVKFSQTYTNDVTFTLTPKFENPDAEAAGIDWKDYIRVSDTKELTSITSATNLTFTIPAGKLIPYENGSERKVYLFALRSDKWVINANHLQFEATTDDPAAQRDIKRWGQRQGDLNIEANAPEIVLPEEGDASMTAVAGADRTLRIKLLDTYADSVSDLGYEIWIVRNSDTEQQFQRVGGENARYKVGQGGYLYLTNTTDVLPAVKYSVTDPAENKSILYVKSPVSVLQSEERNFTVTVSAPDGFKVTSGGLESVNVKEGDTLTVDVTLDKQNTTGGTLYAFLAPLTAKDTNAVECAQLAGSGGTGVEIPSYGTAVSFSLKMIDGCSSAANSAFRYKVVFRTASSWDDGEDVTAYLCKNTLTINSSNVIPSVKYVQMNGSRSQQVTTSGDTIKVKFPADDTIYQTFTLRVEEPGTFDKTTTVPSDRFQVRWTIEDGDGFPLDEPPVGCDASGIYRGNPDTMVVSNKFTYASRYKVIVDLKDKDMDDFGNGVPDETFEFYIEVIDDPAVTIEPVYTLVGDRYLETETTADPAASFNLNLAVNNCDFPLTVKLTVGSGDESSSNPGSLVLKEVATTSSSRSSITYDGKDDRGRDVYLVTVPKKAVSVPITIRSMDGTPTSASDGFVIIPQMLNTGDKRVPVVGKLPADYYVGIESVIKVANVAPQVEYVSPLPSTNRVIAAIGAATDAITWSITDITNDFAKGVEVIIRGGATEFRQSYTSKAEANAAGQIGFRPTFDSAGDHRVEMVVKDKDNGQTSTFDDVPMTWYYTVEPSKILWLMPHGPASGWGTDLSRTYAKAKGQGRVWAEKDSAVNLYKHVLTCGKESAWQAYGYGYKVGDVEGAVFHYPDGREGYYPDRDVPIDEKGNSSMLLGPLTYSDTLDSFRYGWIVISKKATATTGATAGTTTVSEGYTSVFTLDPERSESVDSGFLVELPGADTSSSSASSTEISYSPVYVEAIFSKEKYAADNVGDLNGDGIPDVYLDSFNLTNDDAFASLEKFNDDNDVLPLLLTSGYAGLSSNSPIFSAKMEIRGYGEGLNDAMAEVLADGTPNPCYIMGVKSDRIYEDPLLSGTSTLSRVEWLAWEEYAATHGLTATDPGAWSAWSPERPTDPTKADTDGDGFDDGFEYWFWYRAHVGYIDDETGAHCYLTGRRYNPQNPGTGDLITRDQIKVLFDPIVAYEGGTATAAERDSDNDGLTDLVEFYLGTNPVDFDTDGDGLPDGYEVMRGTDPLSAFTRSDSVADTMRNYDGDAMAFETTTGLFTSLALVDATASNGYQWYVIRGASVNLDEDVAVSIVTENAQLVIEQGSSSVTNAYLVLADSVGVVGSGSEKRLAADYSCDRAFRVALDVDVGSTNHCDILRLCPTHLKAGMKVRETMAVTEYSIATLVNGINAKFANVAWVYGNSETPTNTTANTLTSLGGFGMLMPGRYQAVPKNVALAVIPRRGDTVALAHYLVYQEYGFDPRTAWNANTPLGTRWGSKNADGTAKDNVLLTGHGNAGISTRTRHFTAYDEFLLSSFFWHTGVCTVTVPETATASEKLVNFWSRYTTNPCGPSDKLLEGVEADLEGADTDKDGVPDGWELYVMSGPRVDGVTIESETGSWIFDRYRFVSAYDHKPFSNFSPFAASAANSSLTDNKATSGDAASAGDGDGLTELEEFAGTDTVLYYKGFVPTIDRTADRVDVRPEQHAKWLNKFYPTDPWGEDTDGDGLKDGDEIKNVNASGLVDGYIAWGFYAANFIYGTPVDGGETCIPGGGLNPCSVDTDRDGLPDPWEAQYAGSFDEEKGIQDKHNGIVNGMDGTVSDATTKPWTLLRSSYFEIGGDSGDCVNRDYDRDGLENWQEYLTGTMRCWRYDDSVSRWDATPTTDYFRQNPATGVWEFDIELAKTSTGCASDDEFWYKTLVDVTSPIYNPHLVMDQSPAGGQYFTQIKNDFDPVRGKYYFFFDGADHEQKTAFSWALQLPLDWTDETVRSTYSPYPWCYMGTSPIEADSDQDGMDDYYELFHGLNPLLGAPGVAAGKRGQPCDLVYTAWSSYTRRSPLKAWRQDVNESLEGVNYWVSSGSPLAEKAKGTKMDFVAFPWINGLWYADVDGDDIRNCEEAIRNVDKDIYGRHTDPSPMWMTDSGYTNSLVRRFFRLPARFAKVTTGDKLAFTNGTEVFSFDQFEGWVAPKEGLVLGPNPGYFSAFNPDQWGVAAQYHYNWAYSFEENEGYDTDHDGVYDFAELSGRANGVSDPQSAVSPTRRQAMYFPGENAALQTLPIQEELHPLGGHSYNGEPTLRQYTVECWAYPESLSDSVLVERPVWVNESKTTDTKLVRKNFQLAIKNGYWYTEFDTTGTTPGGKVFADSEVPVRVGEWTHVAATYDGTTLKIYVNGALCTPMTVDVKEGLWPAIARDAVKLISTNSTSLAYNDFSFDKSYGYSCFVIGAEMNVANLMRGNDIDITQGTGWSNYRNFFKGYIDEVRIWDGARTEVQIKESMKKSFTAEDIIANRAEVYDNIREYGTRYTSTEPEKITAELVHSFSFDSTPGADNETSVAKVPQGYLASTSAVNSTPEDWTCGWWKRIVDVFGSVYSETKWVTWITDTVAHLPRFDDTTTDSVYWSKDFEGGKSGSTAVTCTAEPVSLWTQLKVNSSASDASYQTTASRHQLVYNKDWYVDPSNMVAKSSLWRSFEFTGRHACQFGADLLPLGGAYVRQCDTTVGLWDGQGAGTNWELSGSDADLVDGLPKWWRDYAVACGYVASAEGMMWESEVSYNGIAMMAGAAYLRDLARGVYSDAAGKAVANGKYRQTYDMDGNSIPDWWEKLYGITGAAALADSDNDGLPNYVEYLLSEVFVCKNKTFDPTKPKSIDGHTLDYFTPIGSLYVGEIFTDHDLVDDTWEDSYSNDYSSRVKYDAFADEDQDGWCNRSEARYSKMCMPIVADKLSHYAVSGDSSSADLLMADYPIPTLHLKLTYNGIQSSLGKTTGKNVGVNDAPIIVKVTSDEALRANADATFNVESDAKSGGASKTRYIGKWSNRHVVGTLTPGNISVNSLSLQYCFDPSNVEYSWTIPSISDVEVYRGTRTEYDTARRKYGEWNVQLLTTSSKYVEMGGLELSRDEQTGKATWTFGTTGKQLGTVDLTTGEFDLNLGVLAGQYFNSSTNSASASNRLDRVSAEDQTYRIVYAANPSTGIPRHLYLGEASSGYVREGRNTIYAWADLNSNGSWDAGEPFGIVRDVDVSWRGTQVDIELTDTHPLFDRLKLDTAASSRKVVYGSEGGTTDNPSVVTNGTIVYKTTSNLSGGVINHIRVVPYLVRGTIQEAAENPSNQRSHYVFECTTNRVVAEFDLNENNGNIVHEGFFLKDGEFDIDWDGFCNELRLNTEIIKTVGDVTAVAYRLVLGDSGSIGPRSAGDNTTEVNALPTVIERRFEREDARTQPVNVAPGKLNGEVVYDASPVFTWRLDEPTTGAGKFGCSYTAFKIQVKDDTGALVYDSGFQRTPQSNQDGSFSWAAPLYVEDKLPNGRVFDNKSDYTWSVSMYNAKYSDPVDDALFSEPSRFRMQVQTNGFMVGMSPVAVRYFGPKESYAGKVVRVRAYASPDFTGRPVAAGFVADPDNEENGLSVTGKTVTANCKLIGIPSGTYYLQAWIDSNDNQLCDPWESSGYLCNQGGATTDYLNPVGVKFDGSIGESELVEIYLEDADTDGDGLPDAWEYAKYGNLKTKGVEELEETSAGENVIRFESEIWRDLTLKSGAEVPVAGLAGRAMSALSSAGTLALALGVDPVGYSSFAAAITGTLSEELVQDGVAITDLSYADGKVVVKVEAETESKTDQQNLLAASLSTTGELSVKCFVSYSTNATDWSGWTYVKTITVGAGAQEVDVSDVVKADEGSCFIKIKLEK